MTTLLSLRKQEWENVKVETENVNKIFTNINITVLNEIIHAGANLISQCYVKEPEKK